VIALEEEKQDSEQDDDPKEISAISAFAKTHTDTSFCVSMPFYSLVRRTVNRSTFFIAI